MDLGEIRICKNEMIHYKPEFETIAQGNEEIELLELEKFLKRMRLSDHDAKKIGSGVENGGRVKLPGFIAAMRLASLVKQGKKYCKSDYLVEQKILARKSRVVEGTTGLAKAVEKKLDQIKIVSPYPTLITVTNPKLNKSGWFGASSYYTYQINSTIESVSYNVSRRFSDLDWLFQVLQENYKGFIIPSLPSKKYINNTDPQFIEQRQQSMEVFLNTLKSHEILGLSLEFLGFLKTPDEDFQSFKESEQVSANWFEVKNLKSTLDHTLASIDTKLQSLSSPELKPPAEFETIQSKVLEKLKALKDLKSALDDSQGFFQETKKGFDCVFGLLGSGLEIVQDLNFEEKNFDLAFKAGKVLDDGIGNFEGLEKTFEVYLASVEETKTLKNFWKRTGSEEGVEDPVGDAEKKCDQILMNLQKEFERVEVDDREKVNLVAENVLKANKERFCRLAQGLKRLD